MEWKKTAKEKIDKGISGLGEEKSSFVHLLMEFNLKHGLSRSEGLDFYDLLPEGANWLVLLKDDKEVLVSLCSYNVDNENVSYVWVELNKKLGRVEVEVNYKDETSKVFELISQDEIKDYYPR